MTPQEKGRRGGEKTLALHGREHYVAGGKKGGRIRADQLGPKGYSEMGKEGAKACQERHGHEFAVARGKVGGARVRELARLGREAEATE